LSLEIFDMPQPLRIRDETGNILMGHYYLTDRPELAAMVAQAICAWSSVESMIGNILAKMLGAQSRPAVSMFLALNSASAQRDAITAAAKSVLDDTRLELLLAVFMLAKPWAKRRNDFAHGIWGIASGLPDHLLWANPSDQLEANLQQDEWWDKGREWLEKSQIGPPPPMPPPMGRLKGIIAYSRKDLLETVEAFNRVYGHMHSVRTMVDKKHGGYDRILHWLPNEPDVEKALSRLRKRQKIVP
jgi:hypothetical protein